MCMHIDSMDSNECVFCQDILSQEYDYWPTYHDAIADPIFQSARGIIGTENFGQDDALRRAINFVLNATALKKEADRPPHNAIITGRGE